MDEKQSAYLEGFEHGAKQVINRLLQVSQDLSEELTRTIIQEQMRAQTPPQNIDVDMGEVLGTSELEVAE